MKNKWIILIILIVSVFVICKFTSCNFNYYFKKYETFDNNSKIYDYNLLHNGSFQNGNNIKELYENRGNNKIIKFKNNPNNNNSEYVLEQIYSDELTSYVLNIKIYPSMYYKLTLWCYNNENQKIFNLVNIKFKNNNKCISDSKFNVKQNIIDKKYINKILWYKYEFIFDIPHNTTNENNILICIGSCNKQLINKNYVTDIILLPYLPNMPNFEATKGLKSYIDAKENNSCGSGTKLIWNDLVNNNILYKWNTKPSWNNDGYFQINGNTLTGPLMSDLNIINEFSIVIHSKSRAKSTQMEINTQNNAIKLINLMNNLDSSSLFIAGNQGTAFNLIIPNNYGKINIILAGINYTTNKNIIPQSNNIYIITYKNNIITLWLNNNKLEEFNNVPNLFFNNKIIINKDKKWDTNLYSLLIYNRLISSDEINYINYFLIHYPKPSLSLITPLKPIITPLEPVNNKISILPINLEKPLLNLEQPLLNIDNKYNKYKKDCHKECYEYYNDISKCKNIKSCKKYCMYKKSKNDFICHQKHPEKNICPIGYKDPSSGDYIVYIPKKSIYAKKYGSGKKSYGKNKDRANKIYKHNFPKCKMPIDFRYDIVPHNICPFIIHKPKNMNPCHMKACKDVDWNINDPAKMKLNLDCRLGISHYCQKNKNDDPVCQCWKWKNRYSPKCQEFRKVFEKPEDYGCSVNIFDIQDHPDFRNYIRKDRIPCWNCNLTAPDTKDKIIRTWERRQ